jgi:hypothetical protein
MNLDKKTLRSLRRILFYMLFDTEEAEHYLDQGRPKDHIYRDVLVLARFLDKHDPR